MAGQCLAWGLLVTYIGVMCFSGGATFWGYTGFGFANETEVNETAIKPNGKPLFSSFPDYEYDRPRTVNYDNFLAIAPSGASTIVAMLIVMIGVCSRSIFRTTQAIHGSLCLAIFHAVMMVVLLLNRDAPDAMWWIIGINAGIIAMSSLQITLGVIFLKWQKETWITINLKHLFTLHSCFFMARTVLAGFHLGESLDLIYWYNPKDCHGIENCIPWSFYFTAVAIGTGCVLNLQCLLSVYFGLPHRCFEVLSSLLLTAGYGCVSVLTSPLYLSSIYESRWYRPEPLVFSAILCTLHLVHLILLLVAPNGMRYSLFDIDLNRLKTLEDIPFLKAFTNEQLTSYSESLWKRRTFKYNIIFLIGSLVTLILASATYWWYPRWARIVLISVGVSLFSRSLVSVLFEAITLKVDTTTAFQAMLFIVFEGIACIVGFIGACVGGNDGGIAAGIGLLLLYILKFQQHRKVFFDAFRAYKNVLNTEEFQNLTTAEEDRTEDHEEA